MANNTDNDFEMTEEEIIAGIKRLTDRQRRILELLCTTGKTRKEIADAIVDSESTVKNEITYIYQTFGLSGQENQRQLLTKRVWTVYEKIRKGSGAPRQSILVKLRQRGWLVAIALFGLAVFGALAIFFISNQPPNLPTSASITTATATKPAPSPSLPTQTPIPPTLTVTPLAAVAPATNTLAPTVTPTTVPQPTNTPPPPSNPPPPNSGLVTFAAPDSKQLKSPLVWQQGNSNANRYEFDASQPGVLILTAGPGTEQWGGNNSAPMIVYPIKGNFETQVKMVSIPTQDSMGADLVVRSAKAINTWLRVGKWFSGGQLIAAFANNNGNSFSIRQDKWVKYNDEVVYLRIVRQGARFTLSLSKDGIVWSDIEKELVLPVDDEAEIILEARSPASVIGIVARFSEFTVIPK